MLKKIIGSLANRLDLPVEVEDIAAVIVDNGCQDIIFFKGIDEENPGHIHGAFWRYIRRPGVYADPEYVALIPFNNNDTLQWQRVTCCKEMVHLFDSDLERTDQAEEVVGLIDKLLGRLSTDDFGVVDFMASKDRLALYQCLPLIFPRAALAQARQKIAAGTATPESIANEACMPLGLVLMMLSGDWDRLNGQLEALC